MDKASAEKVKVCPQHPFFYKVDEHQIALYVSGVFVCWEVRYHIGDGIYLTVFREWFGEIFSEDANERRGATRNEPKRH